MDACCLQNIIGVVVQSGALCIHGLLFLLQRMPLLATSLVIDTKRSPFLLELTEPGPMREANIPRRHTFAPLFCSNLSHRLIIRVHAINKILGIESRHGKRFKRFRKPLPHRREVQFARRRCQRHGIQQTNKELGDGIGQYGVNKVVPQTQFPAATTVMATCQFR